MILLLETLLTLGLIAQALVGLAFFISCCWEGERRAALWAGLQAAAMVAATVLFLYLWHSGFFSSGRGVYLLILAACLATGTVALLTVRIGANPIARQGTLSLITGVVARFDERMTVFARNRTLQPGSEPYRQFYAEHPQLEQADAARRALGGIIGTPGAIDRPHHRPNVAASAASVALSLHLSHAHIVKPKGHPALTSSPVALDPQEATIRIKGYTLSLGAKLVGITRINPRWVYSRRGEIFHENWSDLGAPIELTHPWAIVFAVEMDFRMIAVAPHTPTSVDSQGRYAAGAFIAAQVAAFIANLSYETTTNHLRYYDTLLVPLAVDAGLGEMGRLGYLLTKKFGPRVRLGAVTTTLPLVPDRPVDIGVADFCRICKKCAACCPSASIPKGALAVVNGIRRWKLNAETCFAYWGKVGTGCNICMRVCPWSHAATLPHQFVRAMVVRNAIARRFFFHLDNLFYGRRPKPKSAPDWARHD
jgi:reductive dehalogenase